MASDDLIARLQAADGDPTRLVLLTADLAADAREEGLRTALEAAAVPHWFDSVVLSALLGLTETQAQTTFEQLQTLPMTERFLARGAWNVHDTSRVALRGRLLRDNPDRLRERSRLAARVFMGKSVEERLERAYHLLVGQPPDGARALESIFEEWSLSGRREPLTALGSSLLELVREGSLEGDAKGLALLRAAASLSGRLPAGERRRMLVEALGLFTAGAEPAWRPDALNLLGRLELGNGNTAAALEYQRACQDEVRARLEQAPDDPRWQRELAVSHLAIGSVLLAQEHVDDALEEYEAGRRILEPLTRRDPGNTMWQRDLSVSHGHIGRVLRAQKKFADALPELEAAQRIVEALTARDPDNTIWQRELAVSRHNVASVLQRIGRPDDALREMDAGQRVLEALVARDPDNTEWQGDLSMSHTRFGSALRERGRLPDAAHQYEAAIRILTALTPDPGNLDWLHDLAAAHRALGAVLRDQGMIEDALRQYEASRESLEQLIRREPSNVFWREELEAARQTVASLRRESGRDA